eukprot:358917-Chlamydomonas_euryale.AAC.2
MVGQTVDVCSDVHTASKQPQQPLVMVGFDTQLHNIKASRRACPSLLRTKVERNRCLRHIRSEQHLVGR